MVGLVGRMDFVSGPVDVVLDIVRLLSLVGEGDFPESCFVTCSTDKRGGYELYFDVIAVMDSDASLVLLKDADVPSVGKRFDVY